MNNRSNSGRTLVYRLTANVASAIAVVSVEGPRALELVRPALLGSSGGACSLVSGKARFARWRFDDVEMADEHVIVLARSVDSLEIHCHGGVAVTQRIIDELVERGAERADAKSVRPTETNALIEGDITAAEALTRMTTLPTALILLDQYQGALERDFARLEHLLAIQDLPSAGKLRDELLRRGRFGLKLLEPWRLTLAGPPNVGKSSLTNALIGATRVLVHHEPGTTRDAVETSLVVGGWPLTLIDTAGIRDSNDRVEQQGIQAAMERWRQSDIGLLVVDATVGWTSEHDRLLAGPQKIFIVINKIDCIQDEETIAARARSIDQRFSSRFPVVRASAKSERGTEPILQAIAAHFDALRPPPGCGVPFTRTQVEWLERLPIAN